MAKTWIWYFGLWLSSDRLRNIFKKYVIQIKASSMQRVSFQGKIWEGFFRRHRCQHKYQFSKTLTVFHNSDLVNANELSQLPTILAGNPRNPACTSDTSRPMKRNALRTEPKEVQNFPLFSLLLKGDEEISIKYFRRFVVYYSCSADI